jgi:hypothetical protein
MAEQLAREHDARRVDLFYREHLLPSVDDVEKAGRLDAPESYRDRLIVSYDTEPKT